MKLILSLALAWRPKKKAKINFEEIRDSLTFSLCGKCITWRKLAHAKVLKIFFGILAFLTGNK